MTGPNFRKYSYIYEYFGNGQKLKLNLLVFFLIVFPFIKVFTDFYFVYHVDNPLLPWSIFNFLSLTGCIFILLLHEKRYSFGLLVSIVVVIILLSLNYLLAEMASPKWLANWLGFLIIFTVLVQVIKTLTNAEMYMLQVRFTNTVIFVIVIFTIVTLYAFLIEPWYMEPRLFNYYVFEDRNQIHRLYRDKVGIYKQQFGIFSLMLISFTFTHWKLMSNRVKIVFMTFFMVNLIAIIGVRTAILGSLVGVFSFYFLKNNFRKFMALMIGVTISLLIYQYWTEVMLVVEIAYDRLPALQFAVNSMTQNLFGLGNGAYTVYVEANNDRLLAQFGSDLMEQHGLFWKAPESDLVYFIASWGILSVFFFGFLGYLVVNAVKLYHFHPSLYPIERHLVVFAVLLIFMGISEDNAGELTWWIFVSSLFGVILRRKDEIKEQHENHTENLPA
jgi:hypothetical protein